MNILEKLRQGVTTRSAEETRTLAAELAATLGPDTTLALHGDMGVGKTTFVQGLARGLGVGEQVTSPTFAIYTVHRAAGPARRKEAGRTLVHLDAYRLENEHQIEELLLEEFLTSPWVLAVEWPEKIAAWLPPTTMHLALSIVDGDRHRISLLTASAGG
ncbi:MAG: tRNA (adenosine(37)-N6)-threonylcarbamoyltransferase complex ATPase subunit type 1 TsaE [Opitutales bacterium]